MTITSEHLIALMPLLIVATTVVVVMLSIATRRCLLTNAIITISGLILAFLSLVWTTQTPALEVTPLFQMDAYSSFFTGLVLIASMATCVFAYSWLQGYPDNKEEFYLLVLIATLGGVVLSGATHLASLFIGIELLSLPLFGLIGYSVRQPRSLEAAMKYMILSAAASSFLLFGMALLYAQTGDLRFSSLGQHAQNYYIYSPFLLAGMGMMLVGFGFKLSLVPFHLWTPDVYQGAPSPVSAFLATASKIAILGVLVRFFMSAPVANTDTLRNTLAVIAFISILVGNLMALNQNSIKRLLGYSSIAHLGYLLVVLICIKSGAFPLETLGIYLVAYLFTSLGAFGVISLMSSPYKERDTDPLYLWRGLFWHRPILAAVLSVMMFSLAGIPLTLGFIGKFYVIASAVEARLWWLVAAVIVGSAIGLYYYLRVTVSLFLAPPEHYQRDTKDNWVFSAGGAVVLFCALLIFLLGVYPQPLIDLVRMFGMKG